MTAPESTYSASTERAKAIALDALDALIQAAHCIEEHYAPDSACFHKRYYELSAKLSEAAAIQRGDGRTRIQYAESLGFTRCEPYAAIGIKKPRWFKNGTYYDFDELPTPPADERCAKPDETSGATPLSGKALKFARIIAAHEGQITEREIAALFELHSNALSEAGATPVVSTAIKALKAIQIDGGEDESGSEEECVGWPSRELIKAALRELAAVRKSAGADTANKEFERATYYEKEAIRLQGELDAAKSAGAEGKRPSDDIFGNERRGRPNQADAVLAQLTAERIAGADGASGGKEVAS